MRKYPLGIDNIPVRLKIYAVDPAFIALGKRIDQDMGRILENVVYIHLKRKTEDIFYVRNAHELDFLLCEGLKPEKGVSVCLEAPDPPTLKRETSQLEYYGTRLEIPMELVSLDPIPVPDPIESRLAHRYLID